MSFKFFILRVNLEEVDEEDEDVFNEGVGKYDIYRFLCLTNKCMLEFCNLKLILWRKFSLTLDRPKEVEWYKYQLIYSVLLWALGHGPPCHTRRTEQGRTELGTRVHNL